MGLRPPDANLFAVTMLLYTDTGNTYKAKDVRKWLRLAGFKKPKNHVLKKGTGDWDGIMIQAQKGLNDVSSSRFQVSREECKYQDQIGCHLPVGNSPNFGRS